MSHMYQDKDYKAIEESVRVQHHSMESQHGERGFSVLTFEKDGEQVQFFFENLGQIRMLANAIGQAVTDENNRVFKG